MSAGGGTKATLAALAANLGIAATNEAEARIHAAVPIARVIYIEPDIYHPEVASSGSGGN